MPKEIFGTPDEDLIRFFIQFSVWVLSTTDDFNVPLSTITLIEFITFDDELCNLRRFVAVCSLSPQKYVELVDVWLRNGDCFMLVNLKHQITRVISVN